MLSFEIVEVNPVIDERNRTADLAVELVLVCVRKKNPLAVSRLRESVVYNRPVRPFLAILQLLLIVLPALAPVPGLRGDSEANIPACCRRLGAHHCMMTDSQRAAILAGVQAKAIPERCPFSPRALPSAQHAPSSLTARGDDFRANHQPSGLCRADARKTPHLPGPLATKARTSLPRVEKFPADSRTELQARK